MVFLANWILSIEDRGKLIYWLHVSTGFKVVGILGIIIMFIIQLVEVLAYLYGSEELNKKIITCTVIAEIIFLDMAIFLPTENLAISMGLL